MKWNNSELVKKVNEAIFEDMREEYFYIGIRFENKIRVVGEEVQELSRDNSGREDERDFPEFGTEEYDEMDVLDGISTWDIHTWERYNLSYVGKTWFDAEKLYLIGGNSASNGPDEGELIIEDGVVLAVIV